MRLEQFAHSLRPDIYDIYPLLYSSEDEYFNKVLNYHQAAAEQDLWRYLLPNRYQIETYGDILQEGVRPRDVLRLQYLPAQLMDRDTFEQVEREIARHLYFDSDVVLLNCGAKPAASVLQKMRRPEAGNDLNKIFDLLRFTIIVNNRKECIETGETIVTRGKKIGKYVPLTDDERTLYNGSIQPFETVIGNQLSHPLLQSFFEKYPDQYAMNQRFKVINEGAGTELPTSNLRMELRIMTFGAFGQLNHPLSPFSHSEYEKRRQIEYSM